MTDGDKLVTPPGGPRSKRLVHAVAPGQAVRRMPGGTYAVSAAAEAGQGGLAMAEESVVTPGGLRAKSLVHQIEPGNVLDGTAGQHRVLRPSGEVVADHGVVPLRPGGRPLMPRNVIHPPPRVVPAFGSGWITYASWTNQTGTPVSSFSTTWAVPPAPATQSGQLIYIFSGIQNSTMIYQPVLQWGNNGLFGGNHWVVASWYADGQGGQAFHSTPVQVNAGDVLVGIMTLTGQSPQGFSYNCQFQGIANTGLPVQNVQQLTWCVETLECYYITQCSDYPATNKTAMASINLQTGAVQPNVVWLVTDLVTDCGQHTLIFDDDSAGGGEVDLWYSPSPFWTAGAGTIGPGESQEWWFSWGGVGDVGPQLIQAEPLNAPAELVTAQISESLDANGHLTYFATVRNNGSDTVNFQWRGGGR